MDSEALKIILTLKEENTLLKRAIINAFLMLNRRKSHFTLAFGDQDVRCLMKEVYDILSDFEKIQQPTQQPG
jgi:hypothetical protein